MTEKKITTYQMAICALMAAMMCILGPLTLPIGPIPVSFIMIVIFLTAFILGPYLGAVSVGIYVLLGAVGLPVFSGGAGGLGKLVGPTGGYLLGYFFLVLISGIFINKFPEKWYMQMLGMVLGDAVNYVFGTAWFVASTASTLQHALEVCVYPFILIDLCKMVVALVLGRAIRKRLMKLGMIQ